MDLEIGQGQPGLGVYGLEHPHQALAASGGYQGPVKLEVDGDEIGPVSARPRSHRFDDLRQFAEGDLVAALRRPLRSCLLDDVSHEVHISHAVLVERDHEYSAITFSPEQSLVDQPLKGLADRTAAYPEISCELDLVQLPVRGERPVENPGSDPRRDQGGRALDAQRRQLAGARGRPRRSCMRPGCVYSGRVGRRHIEIVAHAFSQSIWLAYCAIVLLCYYRAILHSFRTPFAQVIRGRVGELDGGTTHWPIECGLLAPLARALRRSRRGAGADAGGRSLLIPWQPGQHGPVVWLPEAWHDRRAELAQPLGHHGSVVAGHPERHLSEAGPVQAERDDLRARVRQIVEAVERRADIDLRDRPAR